MKKLFVPSLTTKKLVEFLSDNLRSNGFPVVSAAPAEVMLTDVAPVVTPRPICLAFTPPVPAAPFPADAEDVVCYIISLNLTEDDLKASVLTFAILLPITSILV